MNKSKITLIISLLIVLTGLVDTKFDLLQDAGLSLITINRIKLIGLLLSAALPNITSLFSTEEK
ncbi:hypothetical protein FLA105534_03471 [Flavobacterium bizetiae]|uniref:Uncharacterized protein n=1 Tax=Flavobacterium bizetiae TaxID=2704140 RepID=A0A6J4GQX9_9FLAO|nr:hypothetical protein [Flavobacterium bizetiae]CAA9201219.1 hypothetical protein FLA105534_03471 [Flavobacterium bizetiae]CAD5344148.1 hypothetical protein FLA105535_04153 [Flavobacterium bizetiae]CAD5346887.1 hypothetical protein FLA105534_00830 [Flavobacterium bizetiae]